MPDDSPIVAQAPGEQPRPALFVDIAGAAAAPALPAFDRLRPPVAADLPRLLTTAQVGVLFGLSTEAARNDGNRNKLGAFTLIDEQKYYQAEEVVRRWHERYSEKPSANKIQTGQHPNSSAHIAHDVVLFIRELRQAAAGEGEVAAALARTVEAQQQEIKRLTEALEKANGKGRTWWARLWGG